MKTFTVPARISREGSIEISDEARQTLPHDQAVRLLVMVPEDVGDDGESDWSRLATGQFLKGYAESDSIYDQI